MAKQVDDWNKKFPPGTPVRFYRLVNPRRDLLGEFKTSSEAMVFSAGLAVVSLHGYRGVVSLDGVEVI